MNINKNILRWSVASLLPVFLSACGGGVFGGTASHKGPPPVNLGLAGNYTVFADTGISNATTPAVITGSMGVGPGVTSTAITGFALNLPAGSPFSTSAQVSAESTPSTMPPRLPPM